MRRAICTTNSFWIPFCNNDHNTINPNQILVILQSRESPHLVPNTYPPAVLAVADLVALPRCRGLELRLTSFDLFWESKEEIKHEPYARAPQSNLTSKAWSTLIHRQKPPTAERHGKRASDFVLPPLPISGSHGGATEQERQYINRKTADRSRQTSIGQAPANITFLIGLARFNLCDDDDGNGSSDLETSRLLK